ncbi:PD-(D/E)XK nuclease family protein, partial [Patescibacteria group bacterium]|nr:PD-(D/E)XK nuclease family protein [Patescibacteria group bacterium]
DFSIIDYKTGKFPKIGKKDNEQLYLYALAIKQLLNKTSKKMSFYYIEENKPLEVDFDEKKMKKVEEWTKNLIEEILKGDFKATPGFNCKFCDFREICEFRK